MKELTIDRVHLRWWIMQLTLVKLTKRFVERIQDLWKVVLSPENRIETVIAPLIITVSYDQNVGFEECVARGC